MLNEKLNTPCSLQCGNCLLTNICILKTLKSIKSNIQIISNKVKWLNIYIMINADYLLKGR
jgi:hypothetical protein